MFEKQLLNSLTLLGILLIIIGVILLLMPLLAKLGLKLEEVHPLLLWGRRFDGVYIGTSPLLIIILTAIYLLLVFARRG
ncbi:MAG: hypothetical protein DRN61_06210 [Thaumarchaeota archaeon]|nr:MAG: hypothetical protein DRN61_06210 [Nitrososphaerota archaeon]RLG03161.1 MAG: hypothetical protein DRN54_03330 [Nitrososphaerota archaeon]